MRLAPGYPQFSLIIHADEDGPWTAQLALSAGAMHLS